MTHHERVLPEVSCTACGTALPTEQLISLEIDVLYREVARLQKLLIHLKPMLITASYYLAQHSHLLHTSADSPEDDAAAREALVHQISSDLMEAYCRVTDALMPLR